MDEGAIRPLIALIRYPDREVQLAATLAINSVVLGKKQLLRAYSCCPHHGDSFFQIYLHVGPEQETKAVLMTEGGLEALLSLFDRKSRQPSGDDDKKALLSRPKSNRKVPHHCFCTINMI
jgi:hypothetical protein